MQYENINRDNQANFTGSHKNYMEVKENEERQEPDEKGKATSPVTTP